MDTYSSGEDLVIKARKPYTITKQRERWTEEEHNRFLEALKLYGRAWQRIEEHIGTKTAVQIRSHAQKFFSKLEKEAIARGVPAGQTLDIDIPPPRPKRKPSNPYPRKMSAGSTASHVRGEDGKILTSVSFLHGKQVRDLEKEPLPEIIQKFNGNEKPRHAKENHDESRSGVFTLLQETHSSSLTSMKKNSTTKEVLRKACSFQEFVPSLKEIVNPSATEESYLTIELEGKEKLDTAEKAVEDNSTVKASKLENSCPLHETLGQGEKSHDYMASRTDDLQAMKNFPRHVHVHVVDGSLGPSMQTCPSDLTFQDCMLSLGEAHSHPNIYSNPGASNTAEHPSITAQSSMNQPYPTFPPPFSPAPHNQRDYRSVLHISSTFSSLIVSALLQNPAAHAAASFAATFWPYANMDRSADSPACSQGGPLSGQTNSAPSMAAIAAATVVAASAWWAAHGLLPLCAPLHSAFTCSPASATMVPVVDAGEAAEKKQEKGETTPDNPLQDQQLEPEHSEALHAQNSAAKSPTTSTSDSEEIGGPKINTRSSTTAHVNAAAALETHDSSQTKSRKQVDRSSCGSNTPSSSEVETDALEKHENGMEETKEADANHPAAETSRRNRSGSSVSDSWKEVSEEGRLAFQALFSREVLPQSFSPPHDQKSRACQKDNMESDKEAANVKNGDVSLLDLSSKTRPSCSCHPEMEENALHGFESNGEDGLLTLGLGFGLGHGKLKARRTGFKPYKRCSVEAKESNMVTSGSQGEENVSKRIRLEEEAST